MHDVLGQFPVANQSHDHTEQPCAFLFIKTLQGLPLTAGAGLQRAFVIKERFV